MPAPGTAGAAAAADDYGACLWVPYPHQNMGKLEGAIDDGPAYLAARGAGGRAAGAGDALVRPLRGAAVERDRGLLGSRRRALPAGGAGLPGLAAVARLAGRLADNPWLKGGEIRETRGRRDEVEERVLHVAWRDGYWTVRSGDEPARARADRTPPAYPSSLGILHLGKDVSDFPAGDYVLQRQGEDLELTLAGSAPVRRRRPSLEPPTLPRCSPWPGRPGRPTPRSRCRRRRWPCTTPRAGCTSGPWETCPGWRCSTRRGRSAGACRREGLAGILTDNLPSGNAAGWSIVALDGESFRRAEALASRISTLVPPSGDGPGARVVLGVWLKPRPALRRVSQFRQALQKVPLIPRKQVERWQDWETLLAPTRRLPGGLAGGDPVALRLSPPPARLPVTAAAAISPGAILPGD